MKLSRSGEYQLPGRLYRAAGNCALRLAPLVPRPIRHRYLTTRSFYQVSSTEGAGDYQGLSALKWEALQLPSSLEGKSVLDIGCSEGYFAQKCAERGANPVVAVDASLGRLLAAQFISYRDGLPVRYRMGIFPASTIRGSFDYVLCLSVLHHSCVKKDIWKVLVDEAYADDLRILRRQLRLLRALTAAGGTCIVEMPYEYDDPVAERQVVDFDVLGDEMIRAGFRKVKRVGTWAYNPDHMRFKDRIIYAAGA